MAEGDGILYKRFKEALMEGGVDLASEWGDTFKVVLHSPYTGSFLALIRNPFAHESCTETEVMYGEEGS